MQAIEKKPQVCESDLTELGFDSAAKALKEKRELARKMRIAFEHFKVITPEVLDRFQKQLKDNSMKKLDKYGSHTYQYLAFTAISEYTEIPPASALEALRHARSLECFDHFFVATIKETYVSKVPVPDPLLLGHIIGSNNYYFIAQWDDDVKIEDILRPEEG